MKVSRERELKAALEEQREPQLALSRDSYRGYPS